MASVLNTFFADSNARNHLSSLYNVCLVHGNIPQECMQTAIICKNYLYKQEWGKLMLGTIDLFPLPLSSPKLFGHYILSCISPLLATTDNQFGFKQTHGTDMSDMCIFLHKLCLIM